MRAHLFWLMKEGVTVLKADLLVAKVLATVRTVLKFFYAPCFDTVKLFDGFSNWLSILSALSFRSLLNKVRGKLAGLFGYFSDVS